VGKEKGMGGRNQEFALAAALKIAGSPGIVVGSVDSDGSDGPGHQFVDGYENVPVLGGGIVDGETAARADRLGVDIREELKKHNASPTLWKLGGGVILTPNLSVNDLSVALVMDRR